MRIKWNVHVYACALWIICYPFFGPASICVYNRSYILAGNERLPVQMDLSTTETDVSSVGNKFTQIERRCHGANDDYHRVGRLYK